ncbi:MAG TPA: WG repeat-containing protein, partial [Niastella sp.]
ASISKPESYGFTNTVGEELAVKTNEKLVSFFPFMNGYAIIGTRINYKYEYFIIDNKGNLLNKLDSVEDIRDWSDYNRIIAVNKKGKYGVINRSGQILVPFNYVSLKSIGGNLYKAAIGESIFGTSGVINANNEIIVPFLYDHLYHYDQAADYLLACRHKELIAVHKKQERTIKYSPPNYCLLPSEIQVNFAEELILSKPRNANVLFNLNLDTITCITRKYDEIVFISQGIVGVRNYLNKEYDSSGKMKKAGGSEFMYLLPDGKPLTPKKYNNGHEFAGGMARVVEMRDNRWYYGFINREGKLQIPCIYRQATDFRNGYAKVQLDNYTYFAIDKSGNRVMDVKPF